MAESRQQAQSLVDAGGVLVGGARAEKASRLVAAGEAVELLGPGPRHVSRGGDKLDAALAHFGVSVEGRRALDAGASTGGFTDCLIQHGAGRVVAVDVGRGQLHPRIRHDPSVTVLERTDVRRLDPGSVGGPFDLVVADLSFISLTTVVPALAGPLAAPGADLLVLVQPQVEAGRREASRGRGVIRDRRVRRDALEGVASALVGAGATIMGAMASPLVGAAGNVEFFLHARAHDGARAMTAAIAAVLDEAAGTSGGAAGAPESGRGAS